MDNLGVTLHSLGRLDMAANAIQVALALEPENANAQ